MQSALVVSLCPGSYARAFEQQRGLLGQSNGGFVYFQYSRGSEKYLPRKLRTGFGRL